MTTDSPPIPSRVQHNLSLLADRSRLATASEISRATGIPLQSLYAMIREDRFPAIRFGRMLRFDPSKVSEFLDQGGTDDS